ncbi:MAG: tRNA lysidine(34) synthetase TilS [Bacteroidota bacterium]
MHELQKQFHNFIERNGLLKKEEKVLLAVSGGLDSMVMLELFQETNFGIAVAHCNFGLRGQASDEDEDFVSERMREKGIACFIKKIELQGKSIQTEARKKRYEWFTELCQKKEYQKIATAHHLSDCLETTLLNLTRGTGVKGLAGIPVENEQIIRPLLFATKKELLFFAQEKGLSWREDASNLRTDYNRNKVRLEVIPTLKEINPSLEGTFKNTHERLNLLADFLHQRAEKILEIHFNQVEKELDLSWIREHTDLLILYEILSYYGFNYVTAKEIFQARSHSGKVFETPEWKVLMDRDSLFLRKSNTYEHNEVQIDGEGTYKVGFGRSLEVQLQKLERGNNSLKNLTIKDKNIALLDSAKLTFPLRVRRWKSGDQFQPLGMQGAKKVSDLLIDLKVPVAKKEEVLVLVSGNDIAWIIGYRISDRFKIQERSEVMVKVRVDYVVLF